MGYQKLGSLPRNLCLPGAPVIVLAGTLLGTQTGAVVLRLKLRSLSPAGILEMKVAVRVADGAGTEHCVRYHYHDLAANQGDTFAQGRGIPLPGKEVRGLAVTELVFADGARWDNEREFSPLDPQQTLEQVLGKQNYVQQYRRETNPGARFQPRFREDFWQCACGAVNPPREKACLRCALGRETLAALEEPEALRRGLRTYQRNRRSFLRQNSRRRRWTALLLTGLVLVLGVLLFIARGQRSRREAELAPYRASAFAEYKTTVCQATGLTEEALNFQAEYRSQKVEGETFTIQGTFSCQIGDTVECLPFTLTGRLDSGQQELTLGQPYRTDGKGRLLQ